MCMFQHCRDKVWGEGNDACGEYGMHSIRLQEGVGWVCCLKYCIGCIWPHLFVIECGYGNGDYWWECIQVGCLPHKCNSGS